MNQKPFKLTQSQIRQRIKIAFESGFSIQEAMDALCLSLCDILNEAKVQGGKETAERMANVFIKLLEDYKIRNLGKIVLIE